MEKFKIPNNIIAKEGTQAMVNIGGRKLVVNSFQPVELRPRYSLEVLSNSPSLLASLDAGFVVAYKKSQKTPDPVAPAVIAIPVLKDAKEVYKEVKINTSVDKDGNISRVVGTLSEKDKSIMNEKLNTPSKRIPKVEPKEVKKTPTESVKKSIKVEGFEEAKRKADILAKKSMDSKKK